jgi:hypothetical protein
MTVPQEKELLFWSAMHNYGGDRQTGELAGHRFVISPSKIFR